MMGQLDPTHLCTQKKSDRAMLRQEIKEKTRNISVEQNHISVSIKWLEAVWAQATKNQGNFLLVPASIWTTHAA